MVDNLLYRLKLRSRAFFIFHFVSIVLVLSTVCHRTYLPTIKNITTFGSRKPLVFHEDEEKMSVFTD